MQSKEQSVAMSSFRVGDRYEITKLIGSGAYGQVVMATDKVQKKKVAIKKLHKIEDIIDAKRVLREIRILRCLKHENILQLLNLHYDDSQEDQEFGDIYIITQHIDIDLFKVIKSQQPLTDEHRQYIIYQILKALKYLHSANIVHRDMKPSNLLATERCEVRICDFGLSRFIEEESNQDNKMTEYVVTRYYRAPEIMLSSHEYSTAVDIWSLGCTFAELLNRKILFKAQDYIQQVKLIMDTLGKPSPEELSFITNTNARKYVDSLPNKPKVSVKTFMKYENEQALDLLDKMLIVDPRKRIKAEECLAHPYLESLHDEADEPSFSGKIDFSFENNKKLTLDDIRTMILEEVNYYKKENSEKLYDIPACIKQVQQRRKVIQEAADKYQGQKKE